MKFPYRWRCCSNKFSFQNTRMKTWRQRNMIAAVLLLCVIGALCSDDMGTPACGSSYEAACLLPADYLNRSGPISKELAVGKKLIISLEGLSGSPVCHWIRGKDRVMTANVSQSMVTPLLSETDSGGYTLTCDSNNAPMFSTTVILHVVMKRPTKPQLMLDGVDVSDTSPLFKCVSEGFPNPTIKWSGDRDRDKTFKGSDGRTESTISSTQYYNTGMMCCATNAKGQECSQLYDYDLMTKDEVSTVTLSEGQSLLLRCRVKGYSLKSPVWEKGGRLLDARTLACKPEKEEEKEAEMCIKNDSHYDVRMAYLSIRSVREEHSGNYTCTSTDKTPKSIYVHVSGSPPTYNNLMLLKVSSLILLLTWL
ncbi:neural cell adhesion molecule 1 isoform X2 [Oreochromis niloticus]|uniref:neural cell adhesion molecule 1 isoform X2 n=1 Tax=Oreochromis niloticus TaxID=8128 RepID=UPI000DF2E6B5|nr:neural cell adhesion molecule 1 isoform X2 [Oreochromis niloticus]